MGLEGSLRVEARAFGAGDVIGNYRLKVKLGEGAFGVVWHAEQLQPVSREVALKILRPGIDLMAAEERFRMDSFALARMNHPGIAAVLDLDVLPSGQPYFVMELVHGIPITRYCKEHALDLRQRLLVMIDVCHAVQHAHQRAVLHRDLKPSNILVGNVDGLPKPKVIDFGIAKAMNDEVTGDLTLAVTAKGIMMGTPHYMAPEQAAFSSEGADARSDVYALGVVLFELITGRTPLGGGATDAISLPSLLKRVCEEEPPRPSVLVRNKAEQAVALPRDMTRSDLEELDWVVLKALEKQPDRRYASAAALADDLTHFLDHEALSVGPPCMAYRINKLVQRNKLPFAAGLLVIIGLGMSAFISVRAYLDEAEAHERAEQMHRQSQESAKVAFQQSERADDALEFLQDVLKEAGGRIRAGENAAALRAGLQRGEGRLAELKDQPELELLLANELAAAYEAMGDDRQATVLRERAHALLVKLRGAEHEETLRALTAVARSYHQTGRQKAAVPIYEQLIAAWKSKGTGGQKEWVDTTRRLAGALGVLGQNDKAMALLRSLFDEDDGTGKPASQSASFMRNYAEMQAETNDVSGARATLESWLDRVKDQSGASAKNSRALVLVSLARIEIKERAFLKAAEHFVTAVDVQAESANPSHEEMIDLLIEAARVYRRGKRFDLSMATMDRAQSLATKAANERQILHCLSARATICGDEKRLDLALKDWEEFMRLAKVPDLVSTKGWLSAVDAMADIYAKLHRYQDGKALALAFWKQLPTLPDLDPRNLFASRVLAKVISLTEHWQSENNTTELSGDVALWRKKLALMLAEAETLGVKPNAVSK